MIFVAFEFFLFVDVMKFAYLSSKLPYCTVYYGLLCMSVLMGRVEPPSGSFLEIDGLP
jgi:hypothetical protein